MDEISTILDGQDSTAGVKTRVVRDADNDRVATHLSLCPCTSLLINAHRRACRRRKLHTARLCQRGESEVRSNNLDSILLQIAVSCIVVVAAGNKAHSNN